MTFELGSMVIPLSLDGPDAADFVAMAGVRNAVEAEAFGGYGLAATPEELLQRWLDPYDSSELVVARVMGRIVARAVYNRPVNDDAHHAGLFIEVLPAYRGAGIGTALFEHYIGVARSEGRNELHTDFLQPDAPGPRLYSPTGFGSVPEHSPATQFVRARGFTLEQVERISTLTLPLDVPALTRLRDRAQLAAGDEYRLHTWFGAVPARWLRDMAVIQTRMSTDAPTGDLANTEDPWDEKRVVADDAATARTHGASINAAVECVSTGRLVAASQLVAPRDETRAVGQTHTLVLSEHRGHRLGMLVKAANLLALGQLKSSHPNVTTFNAEENRFMLNVNEALGFVPVAYASVWKLDLAQVDA